MTHNRIYVMRCLVIFLALLGLSLPALAQPTLQVAQLTCEHLTNPMGLGTLQPRLSWKLQSNGRNVRQTAYEIEVATEPTFATANFVWRSGKVASDQSALVLYNGPKLLSAKRYHWRVRVWDNQGQASLWSTPAFWEMGLLATTDWSAQWIEFPQDMPHHAPALLLRRDFTLAKPIRAARAYVTAHGLYELYLNGQKVGDQVLTPGWTSYRKRLQYQVYDVTTLLQKGTNAVGAMVGNGWYRSTLGWETQWGIYGKNLGLLCQIDITYRDGSTLRIGSDGSWLTSDGGPVRTNGIYEGEAYDARLEPIDWTKAGFIAAGWQAAKTAAYPLTNLVATVGPPMRKIQELKPVRLFTTPKGEQVADFGQNMVGWVRLRVNGQQGTTVQIEHAEVLDKAGNFYTENLRAAKCLFTYTLKGVGTEVAEPRFTFMGFRYVKITGYPGNLTPEALTGVVVHSDMMPTGQFVCSDTLLNQLQHNIQWGQKGNFLDVPTDCPQRDERMGWTGDAQVFSRTAAFNMDVSAFFTKWLADVAADQKPGGEVPFVIPDVLNPQDANTGGVSAGWSDVACIIPWNMYLAYGDQRLLENQYPSMQAWVEYMRKKAGANHLYANGSVFGDWLFYRPTPENASEPDGYTDRDLLSTAFYAHSTDILAKTARVLGKVEDATRYEQLHTEIKRAFLQEYMTTGGRLVSNSQTADVLALAFGLYAPEQRARLVRHLSSDIRRRHHLSTGFLGTPYLTHVLSDNGQTDLAYQLLFRTDYPSWLYPVKQGATTIWERWDGIKTDGTFQDKGMNSFNHYAYGAIGDWMYRVVAGLDMAEAGYRKIRFQPQPTERLTFAEANYESIYGLIKSRWERQQNQITFTVTIPPNTTAVIMLPNVPDVHAIAPSDVSIPTSTGNAETVSFEVGSGIYQFAWTMRTK